MHCAQARLGQGPLASRRRPLLRGQTRRRGQGVRSGPRDRAYQRVAAARAADGQRGAEAAAAGARHHRVKGRQGSNGHHQCRRRLRWRQPPPPKSEATAPPRAAPIRGRWWASISGRPRASPCACPVPDASRSSRMRTARAPLPRGSPSRRWTARGWSERRPRIRRPPTQQHGQRRQAADRPIVPRRGCAGRYQARLIQRRRGRRRQAVDCPEVVGMGGRRAHVCAGADLSDGP